MSTNHMALSELASEPDIYALLDMIPHLVWVAQPDGTISHINRRLMTFQDVQRLHNQEGGIWLDQVHPDDRQRVWDAWRSAIRTGEPSKIEYRLQDPSGADRWFLALALPQRDREGTITKWVGTCTDIDEQKKLELRLKEGEENWRVWAEALPQLLWTATPDGRVIYINQRYCDYTAATPEQFLGHGWRNFLHPDDYERTVLQRQHSIETGEPYEMEYRFLNGNTRTYHWFLARALPLHDETGQVVKWFGSATNIDGQKRTEKALQESQEYASALMKSNIVGIFFHNGEQIVEANDTFLGMTGYSREDLQAGRLNWMQMTPPEHVARTRQAHENFAIQQLIMPYEKEYIKKDGSRLPVLVGGATTHNHPYHTVAFVLDNSVRRELEQRRDDFINMASHELRTPLTSVKLCVQKIRRRFTKSGQQDLVEEMKRIEKPISQLERLIGELLDVTKIQAGKLEYRQEPVEIDALLFQVASLLQQMNPTHKIHVQRVGPITLMGDRGRLEQVFINLLSNAIKYSPIASSIEVTMNRSEHEVTIDISDHGFGIAPEEQEHVFERFYRISHQTQGSIGGLGIGLYITAEIVKNHHGTISLSSKVGEGSTFQIKLPCSGFKLCKQRWDF